MAPAPYDMQSSYWEYFKSDISRLWQEKKLQIKKNAKESRGALSLSEKKWCLWPSLLQLLYIRDLRFSWREILGKFSLLDYFKNSFIDIVCIVTAIFLEEGLKKWKKPQFALNRKRIEMRFHIFINVQHLMIFWLIPMKHGKLWRPETFCQKIFVHECDPHWTDLCF